MRVVPSAAEHEDIERRIIAFIVDELVQDPAVSIERDESLLTGEYIDSVGIMRLIAYLQSTFRVDIPPTDLVPDNFRSVRIMAAYLASHGAQI